MPATEQAASTAAKKGLLERLRDGVVVGDGGMICEMEKRGYAQTGYWTPEACVQFPEAVRELHREFARAGADVLQALNFFANDSLMKELGVEHTAQEVNRAACRIAREVAAERGQLVTASLTATPVFEGGATTEEVIEAYRQQLVPFLEEKVDFIMCEWLFDIREMESAIKAAKETGLPVVGCMTIGTHGDSQGVSVEECALRMARAGADVVGTNCAVGPKNCLQTVHRMRLALEEADLHPYLIAQPIGLKTPKTGESMMEAPQWPIACEPVTISRWEAHLFAREAYEEGIRYIGGCCFFRSYHIRAMSEELIPERAGFKPDSASLLGSWGAGLDRFFHPAVQTRVGRDHWAHLAPDHATLGTESPSEYFANWRKMEGK